MSNPVLLAKFDRVVDRMSCDFMKHLQGMTAELTNKYFTDVNIEWTGPNTVQTVAATPVPENTMAVFGGTSIFLTPDWALPQNPPRTDWMKEGF